MALFEKELERLEKRRQELGSAEKLLGLPASVYPELKKAQEEAKALKQVFDIYAQLKVSVTLSLQGHTCVHAQTHSKGGGQRKRLHCPLVTVSSEALTCNKLCPVK